jgi:hypothetical protein
VTQDNGPAPQPLVRRCSDERLRPEIRTGPPDRADELKDLILALSEPGLVVILGAGVSHPWMPLTGEVAGKIARFAAPHHIPYPLGESHLRNLLVELAREAYEWSGMSLDDYLFIYHSNSASHGVLFRQMFDDGWARILRSSLREPEEYAVFRLVSHSAHVINYNLEGLASVFCPQLVVPVHGTYRIGRPLSADSLITTLCDTQLYDDSDGRIYLPVILPGEEDSGQTAEVRERVFRILLSAKVVVSVGYSFGLGGRYDRVWRAQFAEAMRYNRCPVHVVDPGADEICRALRDEIGRHAGISAWSLFWSRFARSLLRVARKRHEGTLIDLIPDCREIARQYRAIEACEHAGRNG